MLAANGVKVDFWKTGHSHIKRRVRDLNALAGFEKSGHLGSEAEMCGNGVRCVAKYVYDHGIARSRV